MASASPFLPREVQTWPGRSLWSQNAGIARGAVAGRCPARRRPLVLVARRVVSSRLVASGEAAPASFLYYSAKLKKLTRQASPPVSALRSSGTIAAAHAEQHWRHSLWRCAAFRPVAGAGLLAGIAPRVTSGDRGVTPVVLATRRPAFHLHARNGYFERWRSARGFSSTRVRISGGPSGCSRGSIRRHLRSCRGPNAWDISCSCVTASLVAQPFDPGRLELAGDTVPVAGQRRLKARTPFRFRRQRQERWRFGPPAER